MAQKTGKNEIEKFRKRLDKEITLTNLCSRKSLELSRETDSKILKYYKNLKKEEQAP